MNINKDCIIAALEPLGLKPEGPLNYTEIKFVSGIYSFTINPTLGTYVRRPTGNMTEVSFHSIDELVKKITKFFKDNDKKERKEVERQIEIDKKKKMELDKFNTLINDYSFKKIDDKYYYKNHGVLPRINKENNIYFRAIISGEIRDLSIDELIKFHDFFDNL